AVAAGRAANVRYLEDPQRLDCINGADAAGRTAGQDAARRIGAVELPRRLRELRSIAADFAQVRTFEGEHVKGLADVDAHRKPAFRNTGVGAVDPLFRVMGSWQTIEWRRACPAAHVSHSQRQKSPGGATGTQPERPFDVTDEPRQTFLDRLPPGRDREIRLRRRLVGCGYTSEIPYLAATRTRI